MLDRIADIVAKASSRGPAFIFRYLREVVWFDVVHRTDTGNRKVDNKATDENIHYVASFTSVIRGTLAVARDVLGQRLAEAQFIDVGSGKGKVVIVAQQELGTTTARPAIGIEYDPELAACANVNIAKVLGGDSGARVMRDDARSTLDHLEAGVAIFFLYNPFVGGIFRDFVQAVATTPHALIYVDPVLKDSLVEQGYTVHREHVGRYHADTWIVASRGLGDAG